MIRDDIDGTVIKIGFGKEHGGQPLNDGWLQFAIFCQQAAANYPCLPWVGHISLYPKFYLAETEFLDWLDLDTEPLRSNGEDIDVDKIAEAVEFRHGFYSSNIEAATIIGPEADGPWRAGRALQEFLGSQNRRLDMHGCNVMLRDENTYVISDPLSMCDHKSTTTTLKKAGIKCHRRQKITTKARVSSVPLGLPSSTPLSQIPPSNTPVNLRIVAPVIFHPGSVPDYSWKPVTGAFPNGDPVDWNVVNYHAPRVNLSQPIRCSPLKV